MCIAKYLVDEGAWRGVVARQKITELGRYLDSVVRQKGARGVARSVGGRAGG